MKPQPHRLFVLRANSSSSERRHQDVVLAPRGIFKATQRHNRQQEDHRRFGCQTRRGCAGLGCVRPSGRTSCGRAELGTERRANGRAGDEVADQNLLSRASGRKSCSPLRTPAFRGTLSGLSSVKHASKVNLKPQNREKKAFTKVLKFRCL